MGPRRYEMMDDGTPYEGFDPYQDSAVRKRYDVKRASLQELQDNLRAKNIWVYTNGTTDGLKVVFSRKFFRTLEALMVEILTKKARTSKIRVDRLYKWPSGEEVKELSDIEAQGQVAFVCTEKNKKLLTHIPYHCMEYGEGGENRYSRDTHRSEKPSPTSVRSQMSSHRSMNSQPITIMVISNTHRHSKQSVIVNPGREFEYLLNDITDMLEMANPPCKALHPVKYPKEKADSNSSFRMIVRNRRVDTFYAVGEEGRVLPLSPRNLSPVRNGNNNHQQRSKNGVYQNGYHNDRMTNGYDKQEGRDGYEDGEGRMYRRHPDNGDRQRPDGNDDSDMYTPRGDKYDRRRRESPGRQQHRQTSQRKSNDREEWRRDDRNRRNNDDRDHSDDYNRRNDFEDRQRNGYDRGRDDRKHDQRGRFDRQREDSEGRDRDRGRRDESHEERGRNDRNRDESRDRGVNKNEDQRRNSRRLSDGDGNRRQSINKRSRDDSEDRRENRRRDHDDDDDRDPSRSNSPTESEMNDRIMDMDGGKEDLDKSIDY